MNVSQSARALPSSSRLPIPIPKEHGAYGMLGVPLFVALVSSRPGLASALLVLAAVSGFVLHESLLIVLGQRGARLATSRGAEARRALMALGAVSGTCGALALVWLPRGVWPWLFLPVGLAVASLGLVGWHLERSTLGELFAAVMLSSGAVPVSLAGGASLREALTIWILFATGYSVVTLAVRAVILSQKPRASGAQLRAWAVGAAVAVAGAAFPLARWGGARGPVATALVAFCAVALSLALRPPHPRHLRRIGWAVIAVSAVSSVLAVVGLT